VSFKVERGKLVGFLGPNGTGTTTTIKILCTQPRPPSRGAAVAGYDVVRQPSAVRRTIELVFQEPTLDDYLTTEPNLRFRAYAYGQTRGT
jgi:ABC-2 type transport system ATP-binding protein